MRLICPECNAQYEIADAMIPPGGREVECSACAHVWHQDPPALLRGLAADLRATTAPEPPPSLPDAPTLKRELPDDVLQVLREETARELANRKARREGKSPELASGGLGGGDVQEQTPVIRAFSTADGGKGGPQPERGSRPVPPSVSDEARFVDDRVDMATDAHDRPASLSPPTDAALPAEVPEVAPAKLPDAEDAAEPPDRMDIQSGAAESLTPVARTLPGRLPRPATRIASREPRPEPRPEPRSEPRPHLAEALALAPEPPRTRVPVPRRRIATELPDAEKLAATIFTDTATVSPDPRAAVAVAATSEASASPAASRHRYRLGLSSGLLIAALILAGYLAGGAWVQAGSAPRIVVSAIGFVDSARSALRDSASAALAATGIR